MKHIGEETDIILIERQIKKKDIADKLSMTDVNLSKVLKKASIDALLLEKIASELNVPASYFFEEEEGGRIFVGYKIRETGNRVKGDITLSDCRTELEKAAIEIECLKQVVPEKERIIDVLINNML